MLACCVLVLLLTGLPQARAANVQSRGREPHHGPHGPPMMLHEAGRAVVRARFRRCRQDAECAPGLVRKLYQQGKKRTKSLRFWHGAFGVRLLSPRRAAAATARNINFAGARRAPRPVIKSLIDSPPARRDVAGAHVWRREDEVPRAAPNRSRDVCLVAKQLSPGDQHQLRQIMSRHGAPTRNRIRAHGQVHARRGSARIDVVDDVGKRL